MALQGSIESFSIVDVLRLVCASSKSGQLTISGDHGAGSLWMLDGRLVGGETSSFGAAKDPEDLAEVLFDVMRFGSGSFEFEELGNDAAQRERDSLSGTLVEPAELESLIAEAELTMEEWREVTEVVAGLHCTLHLAPQVSAGSVTLSGAQWSAVVAVSGGCAVRDLMVRMVMGELDALKMARSLVDLGVVKCFDPTAPIVESAQPTGSFLSEESELEEVSTTSGFAEPASGTIVAERAVYPEDENMSGTFSTDMDAGESRVVAEERDSLTGESSVTEFVMTESSSAEETDSVPATPDPRGRPGGFGAFEARTGAARPDELVGDAGAEDAFDEIFGVFDPFGTAPQEPGYMTTPAGAVFIAPFPPSEEGAGASASNQSAPIEPTAPAAPTTPQRSAEYATPIWTAPAAATQRVADPGPVSSASSLSSVSSAPSAPGSTATSEDLLRQMAHLSPAAASAITAASGAANGVIEGETSDASVANSDPDDGRDHVIRFLGSV
jgi:hypothetical protein